MFIHVSNSVTDFITSIDAMDLIYGLPVFRGQSAHRGLIPSIARTSAPTDTTPREKELLDQLRLFGGSMLPTGNPTTLDLLVLAQHFGLKTRLLDWTSNPLVALWFACASTCPGDVYVYLLDAARLQIKNIYDVDLFAIPTTKVFQPRINNARVQAQNGWFSIHSYSPAAGKFIPLEEDPEASQYMCEYQIRAEHRKEILVTLRRLGIRPRTLYPDLEGLCKDLNQMPADGELGRGDYIM